MKIDFKTLGKFFSKSGLWDKPFREFNQLEIKRLCEACFEAIDPGEGWKSPYIDKNQDLVIPFRAPSKYRWWQGGQSVLETLKELGAPKKVVKKYTPKKPLKKQK